MRNSSMICSLLLLVTPAALATPTVRGTADARPVERTVAAEATATAAPGKGRVFLLVDEALALAFPDCEISRGTVYLTEAQRGRIEALAGSKLESGIAHPYVALRGGELVGTAFVDVHKVRTLRETLFVVVSPQGEVKRLEVLAFAEPLDYLPRGNWYGQFKGKLLNDDLNLDRGIRGVTGATLTARATTQAVRRCLALHEVLSAPPPAHHVSGPQRSDAEQ